MLLFCDLDNHLSDDRGGFFFLIKYEFLFTETKVGKEGGKQKKKKKEKFIR